MASTLPLTGNGDITINSTPADGLIKLTNSTSGAGKTLTISGSNAAAGNGGNIILAPGAKSGSGSEGKVGIGTTTPGAKLDVAGNVRISDGSGNSSIIVVPPATGTPVTDKRNIQDAIDAVSSAGGGTVIVPGGTYIINAIGGTATGGSATTLVDSSAQFTSRDIKAGDIVINLTNHCAGKITSVNSATQITVDAFIGNSVPGNNGFSSGNKYCIPGVAMRHNVCLEGQGYGSVLSANPINASGNSYAGAIVLLSVDPSQGWPTVTIKNFKIKRESTWDASDDNDIALDIYNHRYQENTGPTSWAIVDRIRFDSLSSGIYNFSTGIRIGGWSGTLSNCEARGCKVGMDIDLPEGVSNNITVFNPAIGVGGQTSGGPTCTGIRINGLNNRVIAGQLETAYSNSILIDIVGSNCYCNMICGSYIEGAGNMATGIIIRNNNAGNIINGCFFDLSGASAVAIFEESGAQNKNNIVANYIYNPGGPKACGWNMNGNVGIGTANPGAPLTVYNAGVGVNGIRLEAGASGNAPFLTWKDSGGADANKYSMRYDGNAKKFYAGYGDAANYVAQLSIDQAGGNMGIGTTSPSEKLTVATDNGGDGISLRKGDGSLRGFLARAGGGYGFLELYDDSTNCQIKLYSVGNSYINGGSVGIGTPTPNSLLDATGPADDSEANFKTSSTYSQLVLHDSDTSTSGLKLGYRFQNGVAEYGRIQAYNSVGATFLAINPNGGNVGINTPSPTAKLDVNPGTISVTNPNIRLRGVTSTAPTAGQGQAGDVLVYESGSTRRLYINVNGNWHYSTLT
jgi:hypothetical protein